MASAPSRTPLEATLLLSDARLSSDRISEASCQIRSSYPTLTATDSPLEARQHIRRMRGGSQSHLMGCSDGRYYVVKFPNNPQGTKTLANELLCGRLARLLGLPIPLAAVIHVSEALIKRSSEMFFELERGRSACEPGLCFGSCFPSPDAIVMDDWPKDSTEAIENVLDFLGMLVFDIWVSNTDYRQVRFWQGKPGGAWRVLMFDNGYAFRGSTWRVVEKPRFVLNPTALGYGTVEGIAAFEPWLSCIEGQITLNHIRKCAAAIPMGWYGFDSGGLDHLLEQLDARRSQVRELLWFLRAAAPRLFPRWSV
jgi:hypothetical protein